MNQKTRLQWMKILLCSALAGPVSAVFLFVVGNGVLLLVWGSTSALDSPVDALMLLAFAALLPLTAIVAFVSCFWIVRTRRPAHALLSALLSLPVMAFLIWLLLFVFA